MGAHSARRPCALGKGSYRGPRVSKSKSSSFRFGYQVFVVSVVLGLAAIGKAEPPAAAAPAATIPWSEPIVAGDFVVRISDIRATVRRQLHAGLGPGHAGGLIDLRVDLAAAKPARAFSVRNVIIDELRDGDGGDLRPFIGSTGEFRGMMRDSLTGKYGASSQVWVQGFKDVPRCLSVMRGTLDIFEALQTGEARVPIDAEHDWKPVPNLDGIRYRVAKVQKRDTDSLITVQLRVVTTKPYQDGPPFLLVHELLMPGRPDGSGAEVRDNRVLADGLLRTLSMQVQEVAKLADARLRITAITESKLTHVPFEFRGVPFGGQGGEACGQRPAAKAAAVADPMEDYRPVMPGTEVDGIVLESFYVEAQSDVSNDGNGKVGSQRRVEFIAKVDEPGGTYVLKVQPRLTITKLIDDRGRDLQPMATQTHEPYSGPRGFIRPQRGAYGEVRFAIGSPEEMPGRFAQLEGAVEVDVLDGPKALDLPIEPFETPVPLIENGNTPLGEPEATVRMPKARVQGSQLNFEMEISHRLPPPEKLTDTSWVRNVEAHEHAPPYVIAVQVVEGERVLWERTDLTEYLSGGRAVLSVNGSCAAPKGVAKIRLALLTTTRPIKIPLMLKNVPVGMGPVGVERSNDRTRSSTGE